MVEQIGRDDFAVVERGVSEGAAAVAIAQRPDALNVSAKLVIDCDVTALVPRDPGFFETEIVRVWDAPDREQDMCPAHLALARSAIDLRDRLLVFPTKTDALRIQPKLDFFACENFLDRFRDIRVFAPNESWSHLDDGDFASETPEHLAELESDVAPADHDQMLGDEVDFEERAVGKNLRFFQSRHRWSCCASADVDENFAGAEAVRPDPDFMRRFKPRMTFDHAAILHRLQP